MKSGRSDKEKFLHVLKVMYTARFVDEKMAKLVKQNKGGTFQIAASGHEMVGAVSALSLTPGKDWSFPYYRDQPFVIGLGSSPVDLFGVFMGRATKHHSGGRMMPCHFSHRELRIACQSSCVGSQFLQAVGTANAVKLSKKDEVIYVSGGEGSTSQGDFHEALNFSAIHKLPIIFMIQDNGWAISVPAQEQTAGGSVLPVCQGYPGLEAHEVDGCDYEAFSTAMEHAVKRARSGKGPSAIVAKVPRLGAHSNSDDPAKYLTPQQMEETKKRDPIPLYEKWIEAKKIATSEEIAKLRQECFNGVEKAAVEADQIPFPDPKTAEDHVFTEFSPPQQASKESQEGEKIVIVDALNHVLDEEMRRDPGVVVFGQDVAHGKGGVFGVTRNLTAKYGADRCFNTPLAESTIIGLAIGMSLDGIHKPVAEIQFCDYMWTGINQIFNELASFSYRSNGEWNCPVVIRMPCGGYIQGGPYHSQSIEAFLAHCPGLKVVIPSNAADAKGLLRMAIRDPNPVIFLEHKALYRQQKFCARSEPSEDYLVPFGQASIVREGDDVTVVAYGMMVLTALDAAEALAAEGISVEVIDLRTLVPLDLPTVLNSVQKTNKLLITHEAPRSCGFGAEIAARVAEQAFQYLDAPISRVCGKESAVPYSKPLENAVLPQLQDLVKALRQLANF